MFESRKYKDDYYKNLSFIKLMSKEMDAIPIISKVANRELLKRLMPDGVYPSYGMQRSSKEIMDIMKSVEKFLNQIEPKRAGEDNVTCMLNCFLKQDKELFRPVSYTQMKAADRVNQYLTKGEFNNALHELAECVEDGRTGLNMEKYISVNEYVFYKVLVECFLCKLEECKER